MFKLGLKLWSTNINYIKDAIKLYEKKIYHYIELFAVPGSYNEYINYWKKLEIPYIIHAPHSYSGLNIAKNEFRQSNLRKSLETIKFADELDSKHIIFHPGIDGDIEETIFQIKQINDSRITIENKPYYTFDHKYVCVGNSPDEIKYIIEKNNADFCLDIAHAICASTAKNIEPIEYIKQFIELNPKLYHLSDGCYNELVDKHFHLGKGNFDIKKIIEIIPKKSFITIETEKNNDFNLSDFEEDVKYFLKLNKN